MILNWTGIRTVGVMSYRIYLWQQPITRFRLAIPSATLTILIRLAVIGLFAVGSCYLIERPFLYIRRRFFLPQ